MKDKNQIIKDQESIGNIQITCSHCKKPIFNPHHSQKYHKECSAVVFLLQGRENHKKNIERDREYHKQWRKKHPTHDVDRYAKNTEQRKKIGLKSYEKNKKTRIETVRKYYRNTPKESKARALAHYHVKMPKGQMCVICNNKPATDRHHQDYSKPLDVMFLCRSCHLGIHKKPKPEDKKVFENEMDKIIDKVFEKAEFEVKGHVKQFGKGKNRDIDGRDKVTLLMLPLSIKKRLKQAIKEAERQGLWK